MSVYKKKGKYYYKGKYKLANGCYKDYNRLAKGANSKKEAAKIEEIHQNILKSESLKSLVYRLNYEKLMNC